MVTCVEKFPGNFFKTSSCNWIVGNSWEILRNWSLIWEIFKRSEFWKLVSKNSRDFLWNFSQEIPENCSAMYLRKFLNFSYESFSNFSQEIPEKFSVLGYQFYDFLGERTHAHLMSCPSELLRFLVKMIKAILIFRRNWVVKNIMCACQLYRPFWCNTVMTIKQ